MIDINEVDIDVDEQVEHDYNMIYLDRIVIMLDDDEVDEDGIDDEVVVLDIADDDDNEFEIVDEVDDNAEYL